jgi:hypothetical protein
MIASKYGAKYGIHDGFVEMVDILYYFCLLNILLPLGGKVKLKFAE